MENRALLMTKLMPPVARAETVTRERLHAALSEGADRKLTLTAAGPGFGKSTLLAAWREAESARRNVAWLTLGESENDPVALCAYVVEALHAVRPDLGEDARAALATPAPELAAALRAIANDAAAGDSLTLVLDDFHHVKSPEAQGVVGWLVENCPPGFQLVLSTRTDPRLPLGSLRAHGELVELRAPDLALTAAEAEEFLNGRLHLDLSADEVGALVERTEGWPAGVYLAALSLRHAPDRHAFVRQFSASSRHVVDFLADEVLRNEPAEMQAFMTRCSILERLSGSLCDAVLDREGSEEMLATLWASNLFLTALGDRGEWYRFHRLFADVLLTELERREPDLLLTLHRRAAAWYREAGDVESAIGHAMVGGGFEDVADLISESWSAYRYTGRAGTIRAWLDRLPAAVVSAQPRLMRAGARLASSDAEPVRGGLMDMLRKRYPEGPDTLLGELFERSFRGDAGGAVASARRMVAAEPKKSDFWPEACEILGWCLYVNDDLDESVDWLEQARAAASDQPVIAAISAAELSLVAGQQERPSDQQRFAEEAYAGLARLGFANSPGYEAVVHTARGAALAAHGAFDEALDSLERGLAMRPPTRFQILDALMPLIPVVRRVGDRDDAAALLSEARTVLAGCRDPGAFQRRLAAVDRRFDRRPLRAGDDLGELSAAELRVLRLLDEGLSERQVGKELYVSFNTVHGHVKSIYQKLRVSSKQQALAAARALDLL